MFLSTTAAFNIIELGYTIPASTVDFDILSQFSAEQIVGAESLTAAIRAGTVVWKKTAGGAAETPTNYDADYALTVRLSSGPGAAADRALLNDLDLAAIGGLAGAGFAVRTSTNAWATRSLTTPVGSGLSISNQDGVFGSPSLSNTDKGSTAVATHEGAANPHPVYPLATTVTAALATKYDASNPLNFQTAAQVATAIANLVNSSPAALDTLSELATALGNDPNFAATITNALAGKANLAGGNVFTGNQTMGEALVNIPAVPLNLKNSQAGTLKTQLNLINGGGGGGAGSAIDFHTYDDQPTSSGPGARMGAIDDNFSAYFAFYTKTPGGPANAITEKMRLSNTGQLGVGGTPVASAKVQIDSTTQGFLLPRMTSAQRLAIATPADCLMVHDISLGAICIWSGTYWSFEYDMVTTAIQTSTSATYANITELITPQLEPGLYEFRFRGIMQSTNVLAGVGLRLVANSGAISELCINWRFSRAAAGTDKNYEYSQLTVTDNVTSASVVTANANLPVAGDGVVRIGTAGALAIQLRSENNGTGVSIRPNSSLILKKVGA